MVTLAQIAAEYGVGRFDLVKLDVEGSEASVIESLDPLQAKTLFPLIMVEFTEANLNRAGSSSLMLFQLLHSRGYQVCRFDFDKRSLVPAQIRDRIDYENFFATTELEPVNERLRATSGPPLEAAFDIYRKKLSWDRFSDKNQNIILEQNRYIEEQHRQIEELKDARLAQECMRLKEILKEQDAYIGELKQDRLAEECRRLTEIIKEQDAYIEALNLQVNEERRVRHGVEG